MAASARRLSSRKAADFRLIPIRQAPLFSRVEGQVGAKIANKWLTAGLPIRPAPRANCRSGGCCRSSPPPAAPPAPPPPRPPRPPPPPPPPPRAARGRRPAHCGFGGGGGPLFPLFCRPPP